MGEVVQFQNPAPTLGEKRQGGQPERDEDYLRGQQVLANAIFHWRNDTAPDAREAVRFLMHHLATAFRADDSPLDQAQAGDEPRPG